MLIDWADTLHFERREDGRLARHDIGAELPAEDLCLRAARALQAAGASRFGADITILKRVPWGAGLGGGSSDAASTLLALNRLWGLHWPRARLAALALRLGADLPFFINGDNAFVEGIGEVLSPLALPVMQLAVVKPAVALATAAVFEHPRLRRDADPVILEGCSKAGCRGVDYGISGLVSVGVEQVLQGYGRNDLQPAAEELCPAVVEAARWLERRYGNSRMTGSGSAVFARVDPVASPGASFPTAELPPGWVGKMCRSLISHPLAAWAG